MSTLKLSLLAICVTNLSRVKRSWDTTQFQHMLKRKLWTVTSNLMGSNAFIFLQRIATWELTRKECMWNQSKPISQCMFVACVLQFNYKTAKKFLDKHSDSCRKSLEPNSSDHPCDLCQKTFCSKKSLNRHSKLHKKSKSKTPSSAASCMVCKKTFLNKWNVERHHKKNVFWSLAGQSLA